MNRGTKRLQLIALRRRTSHGPVAKATIAMLEALHRPLDGAFHVIALEDSRISAFE